MAQSDLRRIYRFSDTYGRSESILQDDADALISTDFRSFPLQHHGRDIDIYGRENITRHMLRLIFQLHDEVEQARYFPQATRQEFARTTTGIFINAAPRTSKENGAPFYVATAANIRIVTTDLDGLSSMKDRIDSLAHLPNDNGILFTQTEQFRSSYAARLLEEDHGLDLVPDSKDLIPDYPDTWWELAYVDRFGNMVTYTRKVRERWKEIEKATTLNAGTEDEGTMKVLVGHTSQRVHMATSLKEAEPEKLSVYVNEGNIEIVRKWVKEETADERLAFSAYRRFKGPEIGARVQVVKKEK